MDTLAAQLEHALVLLEPGALPVALAAARMAPVVFLAPTFGGRLLPAPLRVACCLGLACVAAGDLPAPPTAGLPAAFLREALVGLVLGLSASLPFEAARGGGQLWDTLRGASLVQALVPTLREQASATGDLLYLALLVLVTGAGGDRLLLSALAHSFAVLPVGAPLGGGASGLLTLEMVEATGGLLGCALAIAAPAVVASVLADLALGLVGRTAPQLPLFFLGLPAKAVVGLGVLLLGLTAVLVRLVAEGQAVPELMGRLAGLLGGAS